MDNVVVDEEKNHEKAHKRRAGKMYPSVCQTRFYFVFV